MGKLRNWKVKSCLYALWFFLDFTSAAVTPSLLSLFWQHDDDDPIVRAYISRLTSRIVEFDNFFRFFFFPWSFSAQSQFRYCRINSLSREHAIIGAQECENYARKCPNKEANSTTWLVWYERIFMIIKWVSSMNFINNVSPISLFSRAHGRETRPKKPPLAQTLHERRLIFTNMKFHIWPDKCAKNRRERTSAPKANGRKMINFIVCLAGMEHFLDSI